MKKIVSIITLSLVLFSCSKVKDGEFILNGEVKGIANGKTVILQKQDDSLGLIPIDTVKILEGKFEFKGKTKEPAIHIVQVEGITNQNSFVIIENGEIEITIDKDVAENGTVGGTYNNDEMNTFNEDRNKIQKRIKEFEVKNQSKLVAAQNSKDTATIKKLQADYAVMQDEKKNLALSYIDNHPKSYISILFIKSLFGEFEPDLKLIEKYYNNLDSSLKNHSEGKKIIKLVNEFKRVDVGRRAPDFSAKTPEGKTVSLKESLGKVTIIDFWASWCGPCRKENPNVVAMYNELHSKGLNIVGVSLDDNLEQWKEAIAKDGITWTQVSNLKKWSEPIAKQYSVNSIPKTFILNSFGVVVAKDLSGAELKAKVEELLAQK